MININYDPICREIERQIKKRIRQLGLVKTGKLLDSISVSYNGTSFLVTAEDYFEYLDKEHNISDYVFESAVLISFIENYMVQQIEKQI
jgi:hypothetical protein